MNQPIESLRALARDMVANSESGHIGMSLGASSLVYTLFKSILNVSPKNPDFFNRDRVVFSAGHCTPLIYAILHLCGYDITIDDLRKFRKLGSCTPGHPEVQTCGIDCSTGQLGQGIANAVGLAIAEKHLASKFNKPEYKVVDHYTYAIVGEGCLMEGISYESMSIAGELNLNKLIVLYDCNKTTLDGDINGVFDENIEQRVKAQGWDVFKVEATDDIVEIATAIKRAKESSRPSLVIVPSIIGLETQNANNCKAHSMKISYSDAVSYREINNLPSELFNIPTSVYRHYQELIVKANKMEYEYEETLKAYKKQYRAEYDLLQKYINNEFEFNITRASSLSFSGREMSNDILNQMAIQAPNIIGGSADVAKSTLARIESGGTFSYMEPQNRNINYGVREFSMSAISNGIALHGGLVPFCSTFLVFADYMKASIRMSALMHAKVIYIFTHDSIKNGEDGATHQPIEQLDMLRSIPNLQVFRPCCFDELKFCYENAYKFDGPSVIVVSKNNLCDIKVEQKQIQNGIYPIIENKFPSVNIFASGEDVNLALKVRDILLQGGFSINLYSILNASKIVKPYTGILNCVIESSSAYALQHLLVNKKDLMYNIRSFGVSGKPNDVYEHFGFNAEKIAKQIKENLF